MTAVVGRGLKTGLDSFEGKGGARGGEIALESGEGLLARDEFLDGRGGT